ncbi:hypothetical protein [Pedobacter sp. ASV28]|jgi:hypothetical protein|uniref:hypothetical protein n=1 Tax=Pedobacter sp. ASV28 TaxID=2795123 RepID=UPI0018EBE8C9|nr:hypothetical protein [Pedobacter sp. ASV28]
MEPFEINLAGQSLLIQPRLDSAYEVFEGENRLATLTPILIGEVTKWTSKEIPDDYARQIGEIIDEYLL